MDAQRILDAAGELFAARGVDGVEMTDVARAAGCSRATLYRCFENRAALRTAYIHREARAVGAQVAALIAPVAREERLLEGLLAALRMVRGNPSLSAWFSVSTTGARAAGESAVVQAMASGLLRSLDLPEAELRARWLVRVLTSLLIAPGGDEAEERAMLAQFVIPVITPVHRGVTP